MKTKRSGWLIGILILLSSVCFAQTEKDSITLDIKTVNGIIDDLILYDAVKIELVKKDSIILIYKHMDDQKTKQITEYKLSQGEYKEVIERLEKLLDIEKAKNADLTKELRRTKIKAFLTTAGTAALGVLVLIILL